ncbi:NAD(P)H-hydrate dehydratase [Bdellovibrionota bacterium FG-2]
MSTPLRIVSSTEMRDIDAIAEKDFGLDPVLLMENAGRAAAQILLEKYPSAGITGEILVFCGKGNNAGDAFVLARRLICLNRRVRVFHLEARERYQGASKRNLEILVKLNAKIALLENISDLQAFFASSPGPYTIVDGLLGTGLKGNLEGLFAEVIDAINMLNSNEVIALDIPTGVSGDTGNIHGTCIQANLTVSFGFPKLGHFLPPGAARRGELVNVDISLPPRFQKEGDKFLLTRAPLENYIMERDRYGHKNSFGSTLLIGGSPGRLGAITMASRACHRMGTGLVTVATWEESFNTLLVKIPDETMAVPLKLKGEELENYKRSLSIYSSIVIGPGMGVRPEGKALLETLLAHYKGPMVLDADALNLISEYKLHSLLVNRRAPTVLTPHLGEMARLMDTEKELIRSNPQEYLRELVSKTHAITVLKGAATLITSPDEKFYLNHYPNEGMATAGSGDVLAGMIGGLLGQGMDAFQAAQLGVYLHSLAGDFAARSRGHRSMTAPDIIEGISDAFKEIKNPKVIASKTPGRAYLL